MFLTDMNGHRKLDGMKKRKMNKTGYRELCRDFGIKPFPFEKGQSVKDILIQHISLNSDFLENLEDELNNIIIQDE